MQRELRREKRFRYRGVTVTADAVMIPLDHVHVSRSNGYGLGTNCSGHDSSKRRIATTQNFCSTIAVSAVTITVSVVTIQVYFSPCTKKFKIKLDNSCALTQSRRCHVHTAKSFHQDDLEHLFVFVYEKLFLLYSRAPLAPLLY